MKRSTKAAWMALGAAGVLATGHWMYGAGRAERAEALTRDAERLLRPAFGRAPAYQDVRATEARLLLEEADELHATERARVLLIEARAIELFQRGDSKGARRELARIRAGDAPAELHVLRAAIELADQRVEAAEAPLTAALGALPRDPRALALASDLARAQGRADRARELAERGLATSETAPMFERRALAHELAGDLTAARDDLMRAAELDPRPSSPLLHLGRVQRMLGDLSGAVLAFQGAAQRNPRDADAWLGSGISRMALGDRAGARNDLERAEELAPARAAPLIGLADLDTAEQALEQAERRYRAATQLEPELALGWLKLGNTLMRRGQPGPAAAAFRHAIDLRGELAAAHNGLGAALQAQGQTGEAERVLERAAELDPHDPNPLLNLARLHRQAGDLAAAETALSQAHLRAPDRVAMPAGR